MGRFTIWKKLAVIVLSLFLLNAFYNIDVPLVHLGIRFEHDWSYIYLVNTVFYFLLMTWLFRRYGASKWVLLAGIGPILLLDCFVYWTGPELVPMRAPMATVFVLVGTSLAYIFCYRSCWQFFGWLALTAGFTAVVVWVVLPWAMDYASDRDTPDVVGGMQSASFRTITGTTVKFSDTTRNAKATLVEFYFVGCGSCEEKYALLKELRKAMSEDSLAIVMVCWGTATKWKKFLEHAEKKAHLGITFLYDDAGVYSKLVSDTASGFPIEFLYQGLDSKPVVTLGYRPQRHIQVYQRHLQLTAGTLRLPQ